MAFFKTPFHWGNQNVYWTLALGVLAMAMLQKSEDADGNAAWMGRLAALGCAVVAQLAGTDYGAIGVALIVALYLTRNSRQKQCILGAVLMLWEVTAPLAFVLLWFYNGERGRCPQWAKWAFYVLSCASDAAGAGDESAPGMKKQPPRKPRSGCFLCPTMEKAR